MITRHVSVIALAAFVISLLMPWAALPWMIAVIRKALREKGWRYPAIFALIVQVVGGRFEGPRLKASVQTPAGDWITNRADGSYRLDVRLTLKTDDGALILVTYNGIGQTTDAGASLRIAPLFETGDSRYVWLTRLQAVGAGERVGTAVKYDFYALK